MFFIHYQNSCNTNDGQINNNYGAICGTDNLFITNNSGATWEYREINGSLRDVFIFDKNNAWSVGEDGLILKFALDTALVEIKNELELYNPRAFKLSQNHPNPFNPQTTITYTLQKSNNVTLKIYNLSGQELETLLIWPSIGLRGSDIFSKF